MSPSPVTAAWPTTPASYTWEATELEVADRYGLRVEDVERFDLNTSPAAPAWVAERLASGSFQTDLADYPPGDYRALAEAAAERYGVAFGEVVVAAGADEALDICTKAFLPPGGIAVAAVPTYAMYRVLTEQRPSRLVAIPRLGPASGYATDVAATRAAARNADLVWLCDPNNPTGRLEPSGTVDELLAGLAADAREDGREPPVVVLDEAYGEFVGRERATPLDRYPRLVVIRTMSKAFALASFRVGFALARGHVFERLAPFRPPGSVSTVSATIATEALGRVAEMRENVRRLLVERERLVRGLADAGWAVDPAGPSDANFVLVDFGSPSAAAAVAEAMLRRGLVPRTFAADHPLSAHLRITVRAPLADDRLIMVAREIGRGGVQAATGKEEAR